VRHLRQLLLLSLPYIGRMLLSVLLGTATVAAGVGLLSTSAYLIARATLQPSIAELQVAIVAVRAFGLARGGLRYLERLTTHSAAFRLLSRLRLWFYDRIEPLAPAGLRGLHSGDLLARIVSDIETLDDFFVRGLSPIGVALGTCLAAGAFLGGYDLRLALELAVAFLLGGALTSWMMRTLGRRASARIVALRGELQVLELDLIQGLGDLLLAGSVARQLLQLQTLERSLAGLQRRDAALGGLAAALPALFADITAAAVLLTAAPSIRAGLLPGYLLPVLMLAAIASFEAIAPLPETFQRLDRQLTAGHRLFELAELPVPIPPPAAPVPMPGRNDLELRGVTFSYGAQERPALTDLELELPEGSTLGLVGPSGAGKSTVVRLITRLYPYSTGQITLGGLDLRALDPSGVRSRMAVISQHSDFFSGTLRENLLLANPQASDGELLDALGQARLGEFVAHLPRGLDTHVGERGLTLSGGEGQRVAIARALLRHAPIVIVDEFDAHLDAQTRAELLEVVLELIRTRTALIATHSLIGFERLDRFAVLQEGTIAASGTHADLLQAGGWYAAAYAAQRTERALEAM